MHVSYKVAFQLFFSGSLDKDCTAQGGESGLRDQAGEGLDATVHAALAHRRHAPLHAADGRPVHPAQRAAPGTSGGLGSGTRHLFVGLPGRVLPNSGKTIWESHRFCLALLFGGPEDLITVFLDLRSKGS